MVKRSVRRWLFAICLLGLGITCRAQDAWLLKPDVAVFYPADFSMEDHLPSLALVKELPEKGALPSSWKTKVDFYNTDDRSCAKIRIDETTDLYGTGEVTGGLSRNGTTRILYNTDNYIYERFHGSRLYQSHPWVLGVRRDGSAFGVLADNTWRQEISLGSEIVFSAESKPFRVLVIEKDSPQEVVEELAELTGKMQLPPLWSLGYQQCRWSYYPDTRVKEIADTFREKQIPCDVIWMDIHYMDKYKVFTFCPERFPNPKDTNAYLHERGFKSIWMIDPGVKLEKGYSVYDSGAANDVWVKTAAGDDFVGAVWPGDCVFPDYTRPETQQWWADLYKDFMATGVDGVWNDMNEPSVFKSKNLTMPDDNWHRGGGSLQPDVHLRYHNVYGMLMVKSSLEGIKKAQPEKRPFILTRSNFLGGQRYAATWTGDNAATWEHLKMSIPMSLNLGLSGQPFSGPDIGGFSKNATPELFGHWIALGTFYPFSRAHTAQGTKDQEPWAFGSVVEEVSRVSLQRRYRLLPYLYTCFYNASQSGMPVMQPTFFADLKNLKLRKEDETFLLGSDLFVVPKWAENPQILKNWPVISLFATTSEVESYLPTLRMRPGAIIPLGNVIQNTTEYSVGELELLVALDQRGKASGMLYHDVGDGYGYQNGEYRRLTFVAEKQGNVVRVKISNDEGQGDFSHRKTTVRVFHNGKQCVGEGNIADGLEVKLSK